MLVYFNEPSASGIWFCILVFVMSINMIILSSIVHITEIDVQDPVTGDADHKRCFGTISRTFWWAMVTMTTVGYGDMSPVTPGGQFVATLTMITGLLVLALPITVVGANFALVGESRQAFQVRECTVEGEILTRGHHE